MFNLKKILIIFGLISSAIGSSYSGPFLLWGIDRLEDVQLPALEAIDEKTLTLMYTEAKAVVIFLRNNTNKLDKKHFPNFQELIANNKWSYLPQNNLPAEPVDYNSNVEVISLVGPPSQQDVELSALYKDAVTIYGDGEVLGILANQADEGHFIYKRDLNNGGVGGGGGGSGDELQSSSTTSTAGTPTDAPPEDNCIYLSERGLMYISAPPELTETNDDDKPTVVVKELKQHYEVIDDVRQSNIYRLIITFPPTIRFRFKIVDGYWSLNQVEVQYKEKSKERVDLDVVGEPPSAPLGFSYSCSRQLIFRNQNSSTQLKLKDIQVQPLLPEGQTFFSDSYNCIGFMTVPIWSGIFVSAIVLFGTFIGILALMDIKTPNRFESNRNKQLTFTVQE